MTCPDLLQPHATRTPVAGQTGASLIVVMMVLIVVALLGTGGAQIALMSERGARNDRDQQIAFQSAETALFDATNDIEGAGGAVRGALFSAYTAVNFIPGCGNSGNSRGLCAVAADSTKPAWLTADLTDTTANATSAVFGEFTGVAFDAGAGARPVSKPRYVIEPVPFYEIGQSLSKPPAVAYRVTAMGFGPRPETQSVVQMVYRKN